MTDPDQLRILVADAAALLARIDAIVDADPAFGATAGALMFAAAQIDAAVNNIEAAAAARTAELAS